MNLQKLFTAQAELDAYIEQQHPTTEGENRLEKKVLALLVELGETANEWRGFKFWSNDQEPRIEKYDTPINGKYNALFCPNCNGIYDVDHELNGPCGRYVTQPLKQTNPLLEEYVDCLHFILSIGNDLGIADQYGEEANFNIGSRTKRENTQRFFMRVFEAVTFLNEALTYDNYDELYHDLLNDFTTLGDTLGFTEEQIEQAYWTKYEINKQRQHDGY